MKRPPKRYIGFLFEPGRATRREVQAALDAAWRRAAPAQPSPMRLVLCESGTGVLVVPRGRERDARDSLAAPAAGGAGVRITPVVTSGTIAAVKVRLKAVARPR